MQLSSVTRFLPLYSGFPSNMTTKYHTLRSSSKTDGEEDKDAFLRTTQSQTSSKFSRIIYWSITLWNVFLLALTIFAVYSLRINLSNSHDHGPIHQDCSCGSSYTEAISNGCIFDILSLSWLPARCRDDALTNEFAHAGPGLHGEWELWADSNGSIPLSIEEVGMLAFQDHGYVYSRRSFHVAHCSFYWRKAFRMWAKGLTTEGRYNKEGHIEHCHAVFMSDVSKYEGMTRSLVRFDGEHFGGLESEHDDGDQHGEHGN